MQQSDRADPASGKTPAAPAHHKHARASVVIPAYNEAAVIGRCLDRLADGAAPEDLEIVVVANGCSDETARRARDRGVRCVETAKAGKAAALNLGDAEVTAFPRFYVDADLEVSGADLLRVADVLRTGPALAASPRLTIHLAGTSRVVRDYYRIWLRLPYVRNGRIGGVIGVSEQGRACFDRFPDAIADDFFLYHRFAPDERCTVDGTCFVVHPARTARDLVRQKSRVFAGNAQLRALGLAPAGGPTKGGRGLAGGSVDWLRVVRAEPRLLGAAPAYLAVSTVAKVLARRKVRRGDLGTWERDGSSRGGSPAPSPSPSTSTSCL
ncbi:glycosyltransferase family 2 protein [Frankia sp. CcWB2]